MGALAPSESERMNGREAATPAPDCARASLDFDEVLRLMASGIAPLPAECVSLADAGGRFLARPVLARIDAPRYDAAAMDGFAVREEDIAAGLRRFVVTGHSYPAEPFAGGLEAGQAVRIMTGAPMPRGGNRVLPFEWVEPAGGEIVLARGPGSRSHVRERASDMRAGMEVLAAGARLDAKRLLVAAAADHGALWVRGRPRVQVIACGDELAAPGGASPVAGAVPDSLSHALGFMARQWGAAIDEPLLLRDDAIAIGDHVSASSARSDVLILAGGASGGDRDYSRGALAAHGLDIVFAGVAIKPGKPIWYGRIGRCHILGLPGNPTAAITVARLFLVPLLLALGGARFSDGLAWQSLPLAASVPAGGDREAFLCARLDGARVHVSERQSASAQLFLGQVDLIVRRAAGAAELAAGAEVEVLSFEP